MIANNMTDNLLLATEYWNKNKALEAGMLLYESLPNDLRPQWAANILRLLLRKSATFSAILDTVLQTAETRSLWHQSHSIFSVVRDSVLKLDDLERTGELPTQQKNLRFVLVVAEQVMKVTYNATYPDDPFDEDSGWWIVACLRGFVDTVLTDQEFSNAALAAISWRGD